ncbi:MAG: hypothetical protein FWC34_02515 [Bacteroidetes bacterium]|nr:hypothetical protein [Bacteroidota bacterium]
MEGFMQVILFVIVASCILYGIAAYHDKKDEKERLKKERNAAYLIEQANEAKRKAEMEKERQKRVIERLNRGEEVPTEEAAFLIKNSTLKKSGNDNFWEIIV